MNRFSPDLVRDSGAVVVLDPARVLLSFSEPQDRARLQESLRSLGLELEPDRDTGPATGAPPVEAINHTDTRFWVRSPRGEQLADRQLDDVTGALGRQLEWIGPVYRASDAPGRAGLHCPLPDSLVLLAGEQGADLRAVEDRFPIRQTDDDRRFADTVGAGGYRRYTVDVSVTDSHRLRTLLLTEAGDDVDEVLHENMPMVLPYTGRLSEPLSPEQWNLDRIVASAPQDGVLTGWDYTLGSGDVVICVVDSGVDLTHPDLWVLPGLSTGSGASGDDVPVQSFAAGHGTMSAGVAAARAKNLRGLAGVAGLCPVLPVAFGNVTDWELYRGLHFAVDAGARVVSMSFAIFGTWDRALVGRAIQYAYARDVVMCAATGNTDRRGLGYPAIDPRIIACGGSSRLRPEDRTTGVWWGGSTFGPGISVVAPSIGVPTTVPHGTGTAGGAYGTDHVPGYGGTSAATPHVAGLAALVLSLRPHLSADDVRVVIESTADKIGATAFQPAHRNGTWNEQVGYGRINVLRALQAALRRRRPIDLIRERVHLAALARALQAHEDELARMDETGVGADSALRQAHQLLLRLGKDPAVLALVHDVIGDPGLVEKLRDDKTAVLQDRGVVLPAGAVGHVVDRPGAGDGAGARQALVVEFGVSGLRCTAQWDPELGFSARLEPGGPATGG
ncbi:S8 family serine peptidase [Geodermatophilus normandii]|uniref:S8 family serine peptidase n=1 Tax=Geodermatophilus normandii TaxID=1137989 RepID=A0A6P0G9S7_9ACTN|nr:S8 family serine peptidase [Geodermatophilus normandii]